MMCGTVTVPVDSLNCTFSSGANILNRFRFFERVCFDRPMKRKSSRLVSSTRKLRSARKPRGLRRADITGVRTIANPILILHGIRDPFPYKIKRYYVTL